jgi:hypothetical protein
MLSERLRSQAQPRKDMGILDDAIRDHLDLKRRRGTDEPEIKRLEDEAFGPPGRPDASGAPGPTASAVADPAVERGTGEITPEDLGLESLPESPRDPSGETPPPDGPAPEQPPEPQPESSPAEPSAEGGSVFHDFAAEEGLVGETRAEPSDPVERALAQPAAEEDRAEPPAAEARAEEEAPKAEAAQAEAPDAASPETDSPEASETPSPASEDTQVHDMAKELRIEPDEEPKSGDAGETEAAESESPVDLDVDELDIELSDEDLELETPEGSEPGAEGEDSENGEDVLEETPEFLRDAPDSDRLWFEQGKPKDFDFDED